MSNHSGDLSASLAAAGIVAQNEKMRLLYQQARYLSNLSTTVLLCGESGVGKDCIAKYIHTSGCRMHAPFIHVNCSTIPQELFEAELFGYHAGTFTGALYAGKAGLLETANRGTLYLDEIGEMTLENQVKLLRFLQSGQITRLGGGQDRQLNVRILSATNSNLHAMMERGSFRQDLYYRLCVVRMDIPPLRERREDIAGLIAAYTHKLGVAYGERKEFTADAIAYLQTLPWPGNIRQLQNFLERIYVLEDAEIITRSLLPKSTNHSTPLHEDQSPAPCVNPPLSLRDAVAQFERDYISAAIAETATLPAAAQRLGIDLDTLNRKKRSFGIYKRWRRDKMT